MLLFNMLQGNKELHSFTAGIRANMDVIGRMEFELAYDEVAVQHVSHCAMGTFSSIKVNTGLYAVSFFFLNNITKMFVLRLFGAKLGGFRFEQRSVTKFLVAEKCKQCEIYRRMCDVYEDACLNQKDIYK